MSRDPNVNPTHTNPNHPVHNPESHITNTPLTCNPLTCTALLYSHIPLSPVRPSHSHYPANFSYRLKNMHKIRHAKKCCMELFSLTKGWRDNL